MSQFFTSGGKSTGVSASASVLPMNIGNEGASLVAQVVKNLQKIWVQPLGQEDPLEEEMATHTSVLAWRIPWTEEPSQL